MTAASSSKPPGSKKSGTISKGLTRYASAPIIITFVSVGISGDLKPAHSASTMCHKSATGPRFIFSRREPIFFTSRSSAAFPSSSAFFIAFLLTSSCRSLCVAKRCRTPQRSCSFLSPKRFCTVPPHRLCVCDFASPGMRCASFCLLIFRKKFIVLRGYVFSIK